MSLKWLGIWLLIISIGCFALASQEWTKGVNYGWEEGLNDEGTNLHHDGGNSMAFLGYGLLSFLLILFGIGLLVYKQPIKKKPRKKVKESTEK